MGSLVGLVGTLIAGGKVAGLTLAEWEVIASLLIKYEPQLAQLIAFVKSEEPKVYDALTTGLKNVAGTPANVPGIPGYASDGSVVSVPNPG